jgi:hypothetical protein
MLSFFQFISSENLANILIGVFIQNTTQYLKTHKNNDNKVLQETKTIFAGNRWKLLV